MRFFAFWLTAIFFVDCSQSSTLQDLRIFKDSLMVNIMTDAFILHSAFADTYGAVKDSMSEIYSDQLLERHQISREELEVNLERIFEDPSRADSIFQLIITKVEMLEEKIHFQSEDAHPTITANST